MTRPSRSRASFRCAGLTDVRAAEDRGVLRLLVGKDEHAVVDAIGLRLLDLRAGHFQALRRRKAARDRRGSGHFRAAEIDLRVLGAGAALEIAVRGADRNAAALGREVDSHAEPASALQDARARADRGRSAPRCGRASAASGATRGRCRGSMPGSMVRPFSIGRPPSSCPGRRNWCRSRCTPGPLGCLPRPESFITLPGLWGRRPRFERWKDRPR